MKERFRVHIGTPPDYQQLILKQNGHTICELSDNSRMLGYYSVQSGMEIHIIDHDPFSLSRNGGLTDVSLVEKYKISDEAYDKRKGTIREFIKNKRKEDPNYKLKPKKPTVMGQPGASDETEEAAAPPGAESVQGMEVGQRCEVMPGARRGTVRFVGEIEEIPAGGHWVGVEFDEPLGHNDGTVKGKVIFTCGLGYGAFVRGKNVSVGDFPVRDIFDELNDDDEEETAEGGKAGKDHGDDCGCDSHTAKPAAEEEEDEI